MQTTHSMSFQAVARHKWAEARLALALARSALGDLDRPVLVHLVVTRRCNLSCGYCQEFDGISPPVPTPLLLARIEHLARLRTLIVTLTGGETLLHPDTVLLVERIRQLGMVPAINTNGLLLTAPLIHRLNDAGLCALQLSVDAVSPNAVTKKALKPLLPKMKLLAKHAAFRVRVNTVLGAAPPHEALEVVQTSARFGFGAKCSLMRRPDGTLAALDEPTRSIYEQIAKLNGRSIGVFRESFQDALLDRGEVEWKCRAGARFFHVCENGRVHWCAPRWGAPGTSLEQYTVDDIRRAFAVRKACSAKCPVAYAHNVSQVDSWRSQGEGEPR